MKRLLLLVLMLPALALAAGGHGALDRAPIDPQDAASLQRGAQVFVNYCLNCHSAQYMRYNRLEELGLSETQIRDNLMFTTDKVGDTMSIAAHKADQAQWFGAAPPDLSVIARSRGADWLYTFLRSFYRDGTTATGWNNTVFPNVGMPNVLWQLGGEQALKIEEHEGPHGKAHVQSLALDKPGTLKQPEYDRLVADLVNYLVFMGEPVRTQRTQLGYIVLIALGVLFVLVYALKKEYWKDVH